MMKKSFFLILFFFMTYMVKAQSISLKEDAEVFILGESEVEELLSAIQNKQRFYYLTLYEKIHIRKHSSFDVIYLTSKDKYDYDYFTDYIIKVRNRYCVVNEKYVVNNAYLKQINDKIYPIKHRLETANIDLRRVMDNASMKIKDSIEVYRQQKIEFGRIKRKVDLNFKYWCNIWMKECIDSLNKSIIADFQKECNLYKVPYDINTRNAIDALSINNLMLSKPNTVGGHEVVLNFTNTSQKTIKYLNWTGVMRNAVNDIVEDETSKQTILRGKYTGPLKPGESTQDCYGTYYNWSAKTIEFISIQIIYMDNSSLSISKNQIKAVLNKPEQEFTIIDSYIPIELIMDSDSNKDKEIFYELYKKYFDWYDRYEIDKMFRTFQILRDDLNIRKEKYYQKELEPYKDIMDRQDRINNVFEILEGELDNIRNFRVINGNFKEAIEYNNFICSEYFEPEIYREKLKKIYPYPTR